MEIKKNICRKLKGSYFKETILAIIKLTRLKKTILLIFM